MIQIHRSLACTVNRKYFTNSYISEKSYTPTMSIENMLVFSQQQQMRKKGI